MPIAIGARLGPYEVLSALGAGGMGEVYRARDTKLGRDVALKVLPETFAADADRLARFGREAQLLASLNHPHIASIYGLEDSGGTHALVLELVEGPTLADRIAQGPLPLDEALPIARQIAEALEAAHEKGIIHRDLKPANVKLTPAGKVKVLDFGLAKLNDPTLSTAPHDPNMLTMSPTLLSPAMMTGVGVILGTAAYMSPEQARGKPVDRRADIWAFGCVLFEMLAGRRPFAAAETVSDAVASILAREPEWADLPGGTPSAVTRLLRRCLQKDPEHRLPHIGVARLDLDEATREGPPPRVAANGRRDRVLLPIAVAVTAIAAIAAIALATRTPPAADVVRLELTTPPTTDPESLALSPDGQQILFVASAEGRAALWLRRLDEDAARVLKGTEGASRPFWSPDSRRIGFFADNKLKRIDTQGGSPQVLANANGGFTAGAWSRDGVVLYSPVPGRPILRVPETGGAYAPVTEISGDRDRGGHFEPRFFPDGRRFFYTVMFGDERGIYVGALDGLPPTRAIRDAVSPALLPSGHVLFVRDGALLAQKFDPARLELTGSPVEVAQSVLVEGLGIAAVSASSTGTIAYRKAIPNRASQLVWFDRSGSRLGAVGDGSPSQMMPAISPNGRSIALVRVVGGNADVWTLDVSRGVVTRLTSNAANDVFPVWSPDGARIAFSSTRNSGAHDIYVRALASPGTDELLLESREDKVVTDWSRDGQHILYFSYNQDTQHDIWAVPVSGGERRPFPVVQTEFEERGARFSPDGKWIAYQSNESGRFEVYLQPFPGAGTRVRVSTDGGGLPGWRADGRELFYMSLDGRFMAASIAPAQDGSRVEAGAPVTLFAAPTRLGAEMLASPEFVVSDDGKRLLVNLLTDATVSPISIVLNWRPDR